jgi:membrane associated rhomboid family serine protease
MFDAWSGGTISSAAIEPEHDPTSEPAQAVPHPATLPSRNGQRAMSYYRHGPHRPSGPGIGIGVPPLTPMVKQIVIVTSAIWLVQFLVAYLGGVDLSLWLGLIPEKVARGEVWRLLTWLVLHSPRDPFHVLFNMLMLWMIGGDLERHWGSRAFLRFYLICGLGAGVFVTLAGLASGEGSFATIGASGALYGLFVAFGTVFAERPMLFMLLFPMKARTMALILTGLAFFFQLSNTGGPVSHIAHLGGAITGFLYLKRVWRLGDQYRALRWAIKRRKFRTIPPRDSEDRWIH